MEGKTLRAPAFFKNPLALAFSLCFLYWATLFFASRPYIKFDAEVFEMLGQAINQNGLAEFFKAEPNYVPLYPLLIAVSMRLGNVLGVPYLSIQVVLQIGFLLAAQILILKILRKLNVHRLLAAAVVLYFGISPAMVNAAFSLYSEIATFPFVLWAVLAAAGGWRAIQEGSLKRIFIASLGLVLPFLFVTMANAVFEYIFNFFLLAYFLFSLVFLARKEKTLFLRGIFFIAVTFVFFQSALLPYRAMNLKYNGHKSLVIKGAWSLYANTERRTGELTPRQFLVAAAFIPGEGVCREIFGEKECSFWSIGAQHGVGMRKLNELRAQGIPNSKIDSVLIGLSKEMALQKPLSYVLLTFMEALKMFFWESTKVGFVFYPAWLEKLYDITVFKNGLRFLFFILSFVAFICLKISLWKNKKRLAVREDDGLQNSLLFFIFVMLTAFILMHSFFCIATRYTFPIVSLYLVTIGWALDKMIFKKL